MDNLWSRLRSASAGLLVVAALASHARADEPEIDVRSAEYLDVVQTADGSIWKGLVIEQTPNVSYKIATADGSLHVIKAADVVKITKQRNKRYPGAAAAARPAPPAATSDPAATGEQDVELSGRADAPSWSLPATTTGSGLRLEAAGVLAIPVGDIGPYASTSFSPDVRAGYEVLFGNFGLEGGGSARFTYWRMDADEDTLWTMETMAYGRAALHISRVALHAGVGLGLDTNYIYSAQLDNSKTTVGFGMNLGASIDVAATPNLALEFGFDYHPGTDRVSDSSDASVSYFALRFGAGLRM